MEPQDVRDISEAIRANIRKAIVGQDSALQLVLISLLAEGHILIEGMPGLAKTLLARAFAGSLSLKFNRIQFTPDLMPGDVLGTNIYNFQTNAFALTKGPIFTEILLADEINRTPPKTQAALLQAMHERFATIDGKAYPLGSAFIVVATQNPIEQHGTYPLPEAQLDRFLFKHTLDYPGADDELEIVRRHTGGTVMPDLDALGIKPVANLKKVKEMRDVIAKIRVAEEIIAYCVGIVRATRDHPSLQAGASPRAAAMLTHASRCLAVLEGRDYVIPDDVKQLVLPALRHRILLSPGSEIENLLVDDILLEIVDQTEAPR